MLTDKDSGIVNDPNDWSREVGDPRYIIDLLARIVTVSLDADRRCSTTSRNSSGSSAPRLTVSPRRLPVSSPTSSTSMFAGGQLVVVEADLP